MLSRVILWFCVQLAQSFQFPDDFGSSSDDDDSDEEDGGWLASSTFGTGAAARAQGANPTLDNGIEVRYQRSTIEDVIET